MSMWSVGPNFPVHRGDRRQGAIGPRPHMRGQRMAPGRWSRQYDACIECGTTERKHAARGACYGCYAKKVVA